MIMKWYEGTIAEAVSYSQTQKALFCVVILGTDDASHQLEESLMHNDVVSLISENQRFVCVRLNDGTEEHQQFLRLYTNAKSPTIYCISAQGKPIEIISTPLDAAELKKRFESALERHEEVIASSVSQASSTPAATSSVPSESQQPPLEDRIERAKKLAAAKQQKKMAEEAAAEKQREIERREAGRGASDLKKWQEDEETKKLAEERRKDKKADALLKQRLKEQIAQDRIDRQERFNPVDTGPAVPTLNTFTPPKPPANYSGQARLQFRLPTGAAQNHAFSPDTTLREVKQFLVTNAVVPFRDFSISVAFPRRQFSAAEYSATLRDLELLPSAALLIVPITSTSGSIIENAGNAGQGLIGFLSALIGFVFYPITLVLSFFQRAILPAPKDTKSQPAKSESDKASTSGASGSGNVLGGKRKDASADQSSASSVKQRKESSNPDSRSDGSNFGTDGNVHRLRTDDSDSDDGNTWNGNSTQQM